MKKKITESLRSLSLYDMTLSVDDLIKLFNSYTISYTGWSDLRLVIANTYSDEVMQFSIVGDRLETDKECQRRLKSEEKAKASAEKRGEKHRTIELKELARLKKKYETTSNSKSK